MKIGPWGLLARKESLNVIVFCMESRDRPGSEGTGDQICHEALRIPGSRDFPREARMGQMEESGGWRAPGPSGVRL